MPCQGCSTTIGRHHSCYMQVSSALLQYIRWMTCFWLQFTHNVSFHTIRLSSKESCLKINVKNGLTFAGCHLATHPKSGSCGSKGIRLLIFLLFVLETSQYPSGRRLEEVMLFVRLDGEHPSSSHRICRLNLPHVNEIKNLIVNPGFVLVVSSYFLSWCFLFVYGISFWPLFLPASPQVAIQRSNMSLVRPSTRLGTSIFILPKLLVLSLRYNDLCTHDRVIKLHMSC